mgnify:CR=1 FL=1
MKLIREEVEAVEVLYEEKGGKKTFYIQGPFLQGDIKNRNGESMSLLYLPKRSGDITNHTSQRTAPWVNSDILTVPR